MQPSFFSRNTIIPQWLLFLLLILPAVGFLLGSRFTLRVYCDDGVACTMEAKLCPDGSYVSRQPPTCEFALCPGETSGGSGEKPGRFCGGIAGIQCPKGMRCVLDGNYPDAGGTCR